MSRRVAVVLAVVAVVAGVGAGLLVLASDHQEATAAFAIFGPAVGWAFIGTGLYAWRREPENRTGKLMVALGSAWFVSTLEAANSGLVLTIGPLRVPSSRRVPSFRVHRRGHRM